MYLFKHICYIVNCERDKDMKCNSSFLTKEGCDTSSYRSHKNSLAFRISCPPQSTYPPPQMRFPLQ